MSTPDPGYTPDPADVELVADAIVDARLQGHRDWTDRIARAVLAALAAAGRLAPAEVCDHIWRRDADGVDTCQRCGGLS